MPVGVFFDGFSSTAEMLEVLLGPAAPQVELRTGIPDIKESLPHA